MSNSGIEKRAWNALRWSAGIETEEQAIAWLEAGGRLEEIPNVGRKTAMWIKENIGLTAHGSASAASRAKTWPSCVAGMISDGA